MDSGYRRGLVNGKMSALATAIRFQLKGPCVKSISSALRWLRQASYPRADDPPGVGCEAELALVLLAFVFGRSLGVFETRQRSNYESCGASELPSPGYIALG